MTFLKNTIIFFFCISLVIILCIGCSKEEELIIEIPQPDNTENSDSEEEIYYWDSKDRCEIDGVTYLFMDRGYVNWEKVVVIDASSELSSLTVHSHIKVEDTVYPVVMIYYAAFKNKPMLKELHLPSTISVIMEDAFLNTNVDKLYIEDLTSWCNLDINIIWHHDFLVRCDSPIKKNTKLYVSNQLIEDRLILPPVKKINNCCFRNFNCREILINDSTEVIGLGAFSYNSQLEKIYLGENLTGIGHRAFEYCKNLKEVRLPKNLTTLARMAFYACTNLEDLYVNEGLLYLNPETFAHIENLKIHIPNIESWNVDQSFYSSTDGYVSPFTQLYDLYLNDSKIIDLIIPEGITDLKTGAYGYSSIESVKLPETLNYIGDYCFYRCKNLNSIYLPCIELPETSDRPFYYDTYSDCTLYVPENSLDLYKTTEPWNQFKAILPIE